MTDGELVASLENAGTDLRSDSEVEFSVNRSGTMLPALPCRRRDFLDRPRGADERVPPCRCIAHQCRAELRRTLLPHGVTDNGRGLDASHGEKQGHWGLRGITDAHSSSAGTCGSSDPASGTQIIASVPSYRAYRNHSRFMFYVRALQFISAGRPP